MIDKKTHYLKSVFLFLIIILPLKWNAAVDNETLKKPKEFLYHKLDSLEGFEVKARTAEITELNGSPVLKLDGMIVFSKQKFSDASIEVEILAQGACYPGIAFRIADDKNYELAYAVPHTSNQVDAIQYDPVFNMSNTWQLHNGEPYQKAAAVPTGEWFSLRIDITGHRAAIWVGDQSPLVIERLSHPPKPGTIGLWTFKPAFFRNLRITAPGEIGNLKGKSAQAPLGAINAWNLHGGGILKCDPTGILNLNRYMEPSKEAVKISRDFRLAASSKVVIGVGFSDILTLFIDGKEIFQGSHVFKGFGDIPSRGWVSPDYKKIELPLKAGSHKISAELKVTEPFGWGLIVTLNSQNLQLQPLED
jgi:hypothetical protein